MTSKKRSWTVDQLAKSEFFHQKLHEWALIEVAQQIEQVKGESLFWDKPKLAISEKAWDKVIHRGIKPVTLHVLQLALNAVERFHGKPHEIQKTCKLLP